MDSVPGHANQPLSHFSRHYPSLNTFPNFMQPNLNVYLAVLIGINIQSGKSLTTLTPSGCEEIGEAQLGKIS